MAEQRIPLDNGDTIIIDTDRRPTTFDIDSLYQYRLVDESSDVVRGEGYFVPNVDDLIIAYEIGLMRVSRVDLTSYVADLVLWELPKSASEVGVEDVLLGTGPGYSSESFRALLDTRVFPYRLRLDGRLHMYGTDAKEFRVFLGTNTTESGEIVSAYYTQAGDYVSDAIPLELVDTEEGNNLAQWAPVMGYTSKQMPNGQLVTAVCYNDQGMVISYNKLLVHNTNVPVSAETGLKRVQSVEIISPYLSTSEPNILEVPINATVSQLVMRGKVTYTSGETRILDVVDESANGKLKILGLKYWSPTIGGREQEITLDYTLDPDEEYSYLQGETYSGSVQTFYKIRALPVDPAYSLKLYAFPVWVSSLVGYQLDYWLYDLERQTARRVPKAAVELGENSPPFDGLEYTSVQHIKLQVNLAVMDPEYGAHTHVQSLQIALLRDGGIRMSNWRVKFSGNQPVWYGEGLEAAVHAIGSGMSTVRIHNGETEKATWLDRVFYATNPLYDPQTEVKAPEPTHFILVTKTRTFEFPISQWQNDLTFINDLNEGETMFVRWVKRLANNDLQLGVSGLPVHAY